MQHIPLHAQKYVHVPINKAFIDSRLCPQCPYVLAVTFVLYGNTDRLKAMWLQLLTTSSVVNVHLYLIEYRFTIQTCYLHLKHGNAVRHGFKSKPRRCRVTVLDRLFTHIVAVFTKQQKLVAAFLRVARVTAGLEESNGSLPPGLWLASSAG